MIAERNIATDRKLFPKSALVFIDWEKPNLQNNQLEHNIVKTLVIDSDTGGAIKGPGRFDYFWGYGPKAGELAGKTNTKAKVWYLFPKKYFVEE